MPRPRSKRKISFDPEATYFKPRGVPMRLIDSVDLSMEEVEAMRLKNLEGLSQDEAAAKMGTSQSTFQRILSSAYGKTTEALVEGKAIRIENGDRIDR